MVKREDLQGKTNPEIESLLMNDTAEFQAEMATKNLDELKEAEASLMEEMKAYDEYLNNVQYKLPEKAAFDGQEMNDNKVRGLIVDFLNKIEVDWQMTLAILQGVKFWKKDYDGFVTYAVYNSTLRLLSMLKFKGDVECRNILLVNNWLSTAHDEYTKDNIYTHYMATKHQAIMNQMKAVAEAEPEEPEGPTNVVDLPAPEPEAE